MKVLFLDVDGVLNSMASRRLHGFRLGVAQCHVTELVRVIESTGCKIVVSSAWRHQTVERTLAMKSAFGIAMRAVDGGRTVLREIIGVTDDEEGTRDEQISRWLAAHHEVETFAIVDDECMETLSDRLVQTNFESGLTPERADVLISLLGRMKESVKRLRALRAQLGVCRCGRRRIGNCKQCMRCIEAKKRRERATDEPRAICCAGCPRVCRSILICPRGWTKKDEGGETMFMCPSCKVR